MPDTTHQRLRGEVFERNVAALTPPPPAKPKGGILSPDHYKSFIVNIRPKNWKDKFWIGQIENYENAKFIADAVFHYIGRPSFHFTNAPFTFPPLECSGTPAPLTNRETCLRYATSIAKGDEFKHHRADFMMSVKKLALEEVKSVEVQRLLWQLRSASGSGVVSSNADDDEDDDDEEGVQAGYPTAMEVDDPNEQTAHVLLVPVLVPAAVDRNVKGGNALVPGFDMSGSGFTLQSDLTSVDDFWVEASLTSLKDGDFEDHHGSPTDEEEGDFCSATRGLETNSFDPKPHSFWAFENFRDNFFAMEDAAVD